MGDPDAIFSTMFVTQKDQNRSGSVSIQIVQ
jgi:hypothetical protein